MTKTLIDIDDDLLTQSQEILGTTTKKDTVNGALRELVRNRAARQFIVMARSGAFRIQDTDPTERTWRR
jgi:Arc/MetJ family transcription regulator